MTESLDPSRRRLVQLLAGAPLLPLASGSLAATLLTACGGSDAAAPAPKLMAVTFSGMAAPTLADPARMATTTVASSLSATYSDGTTQSYKLAYQPFFITGALVANLSLIHI